MTTPFCFLGKHAVTPDQAFRLVRGSVTIPDGQQYPRTGLPWHPCSTSDVAVIVCSEHDTGEWAAAPTAD